MTSPAEHRLLLDGESVSFREGETLFELARRHGDAVPSLCFDDRLEPLGACRLCVVEVEGQARPVASCTTQAADGMVVRTMTEALERHRKALCDLVVSENPAGATIDPLRGSASQELAALAVRYEADGGRFAGARSGASRTDDPNPMILRDYDHCISCYRCVRVCSEQQGDDAITVGGRGFATRITTEFEGPLADSACTFCGQCVQTCPTGALADRRALRHADAPGELAATRSVCPYCGVGCSLDILTKGERIVGVQPAFDGPANEGALCVKGQFAWEWVQHPDRLATPLVREDGELVEASWDEALDRAADGFREAARAHGREAVYAVASGRAPHESAYTIQKLVRTCFQSNHVDNCSRA
jgi:predicted molibdopterin-dependent oxidoreductase YjgC